MWKVKPGIETVFYVIESGGRSYSSKHPADVANELIRRSDSYRCDGASLTIDGGIRYRLSDLEKLVA